jgi:hypothetical protein
LSVLGYTYLYSSIYLLSSSDLSPSHSSSQPNNLTPHVLSEWMVEVCRFDEYVFGSGLCFDPAQIIGGMSRVV